MSQSSVDDTRFVTGPHRRVAAAQDSCVVREAVPLRRVPPLDSGRVCDASALLANPAAGSHVVITGLACCGALVPL